MVNKVQLWNAFRIATLSVVLIMIYNFVTYRSLQVTLTQEEKEHLHSYSLYTPSQLATRLSRAIQIPTISYEEQAKVDTEELKRFLEYLETTFPKCYSYLEHERINQYSMIFKWKGLDPSLSPIMLAAHYDVVPATDDGWEFPPFSGKVDDEFIWGRGTMDNKGNLMGILEAAENLLAEGFTPTRTVYFAFGHDEEIEGFHGAHFISETLSKRGVKLEFVLDEGLAVIKNTFPGITKYVALIGVVEKGYAMLELEVQSVGGHSSMPPTQTAIGIISKAITNLESHPHPMRPSPTLTLLDEVGREAPFWLRAVFSNMWLFQSLLLNTLSKQPTFNAFLRTTTAVTTINGGVKPNVLPNNVKALVNHRVVPGDTVQDVVEYDRKIINDDRVKINVLASLEASPVTRTDTPSYKVVQRTILQVFPETIISSGLMMANTDTRHYWNLTDNIYRFSPLKMDKTDIQRLHGYNERLAIDNYVKMIDFYYHLLRYLDRMSH